MVLEKSGNDIHKVLEILFSLDLLGLYQQCYYLFSISVCCYILTLFYFLLFKQIFILSPAICSWHFILALLLGICS